MIEALVKFNDSNIIKQLSDYSVRPLFSGLSLDIVEPLGVSIDRGESTYLGSLEKPVDFFQAFIHYPLLVKNDDERELAVALLRMFRGKSTKSDVAAIVMGFLRRETSELLGVNPNSSEYLRKCESASSALLPLVQGLNKEVQQEVYSTLSSIAPERADELYGSFLILLFVRTGVAQRAALERVISQEEVNVDVLARVLLDQSKEVIRQAG